MSTNTTILQGRFTSTGANVLIPLPSGVTWMNTYNITTMASPANGNALSAYWQAGMPANSGIFNLYLSSSTAAVQFYSTSGGFTYIDTSAPATTPVNSTITAISTAASPVVTNTGVNGLVSGSVVRITKANGGATGINGIDFAVGSASLSNTTFQLFTCPQLSVAATAGAYQVIPFDPIYYPRHRVIVSLLSSGGVTSILTNVAHGYQVGQLIRLNFVDSIYGSFVALNNFVTTVTALLDDYSFDISDDLTAFGTSTLPVGAASPYTPAQVTPVGMNTSYAESQSVNVLSDATINTAQTGLLLQAGASEPAGASGNVIYWTAGQSFSVNNQ